MKLMGHVKISSTDLIESHRPFSYSKPSLDCLKSISLIKFKKPNLVFPIRFLRKPEIFLVIKDRSKVLGTMS
jgi:hypothetical protein